MTRAAVVDLDGTIVRGSTERLFAIDLARRGMLGPRQAVPALLRAATLPLVGQTRALRRNKRWLAGLSVDAVREWAESFVRGRLPPHFRSAVLDRLTLLRADGHRLLLLTGAPEFLARSVGARLDFDDVIGTGLEVEGGRYTGRILGPHYFGEVKSEAVDELVRRHALDLPASIGFADHASDVPFLERFGRAVAVAPAPRLRAEASRRGWSVIEGE